MIMAAELALTAVRHLHPQLVIGRVCFDVADLGER
jgi:hypothetical protein